MSYVLPSQEIKVAVRGNIMHSDGVRLPFHHITLTRPYPCPLLSTLSTINRRGNTSVSGGGGTSHSCSLMRLHHYRESISLLTEILCQLKLAPHIHLPENDQPLIAKRFGVLCAAFVENIAIKGQITKSSTGSAERMGLIQDGVIIKYRTLALLLEIFSPHALQRKIWGLFLDDFAKYVKLGNDATPPTTTLIDVKIYDDSADKFCPLYPLFVVHNACTSQLPVNDLNVANKEVINTSSKTNTTTVPSFSVGQGARLEVNIPVELLQQATLSSSDTPSPQTVPSQTKAMSTFKLMECCVERTRLMTKIVMERRAGWIEDIVMAKRNRTTYPVEYTPKATVVPPTIDQIRRFEKETLNASVLNFIKAFYTVIYDYVERRCRQLEEEGRRAGAPEALLTGELMELVDVSMVRAFIGGIEDRIKSVITEEDDIESVGDPVKLYEFLDASSDDDKCTANSDEEFNLAMHQRMTNVKAEIDKDHTREEIDEMNKVFAKKLMERREERKKASVRAKEKEKEKELGKGLSSNPVTSDVYSIISRVMDPYLDEAI